MVHRSPWRFPAYQQSTQPITWIQLKRKRAKASCSETEELEECTRYWCALTP